MSMSTHVVGFRPPDAKWKRMKSVYETCIKADVPIPEEVSTYFDDEEPDEAGVEINLEDTEACSEWSYSASEGYEIDVTKLPKDLKIIRVYNSY